MSFSSSELEANKEIGRDKAGRGKNSTGALLADGSLGFVETAHEYKGQLAYLGVFSYNIYLSIAALPFFFHASVYFSTFFNWL